MKIIRHLKYEPSIMILILGREFISRKNTYLAEHDKEVLLMIVSTEIITLWEGSSCPFYRCNFVSIARKDNKPSTTGWTIVKFTSNVSLLGLELVTDEGGESMQNE